MLACVMLVNPLDENVCYTSATGAKQQSCLVFRVVCCAIAAEHGIAATPLLFSPGGC